MTAVDLFYDDLDACAADLTEAATQLQFDASRLRGDDPGVGAPLGRYQLKAELNRRMDQPTGTSRSASRPTTSGC